MITVAHSQGVIAGDPATLLAEFSIVASSLADGLVSKGFADRETVWLALEFAFDQAKEGKTKADGLHAFCVPDETDSAP